MSARLLPHAQAVLWLNEGETVPAVAVRLRVTRQAVYTWLAHFPRRRPLAMAARLMPGPRSGRPRCVWLLRTWWTGNMALSHTKRLIHANSDGALMNKHTRKFVGKVIPYLPTCLLVPLLRRSPSLATSVQRRETILWSKYLGDLRVLIDLGNVIEASLLSGTYDTELARVFDQFVKPGHCCIDVGANVGAVTLHLAKLVGPQGHVVAVEPGPPYFERLGHNLELNPKIGDRVTPVKVGLADAPGTLHWQADPDAPYNAWMFDVKPWEAAGLGTPIPVETLDGLVERLCLPKVDFIKIDVETMELEVLRGGRRTLQGFRPVVLFETMEWARAYRQQVSGINLMPGHIFRGDE
jgi:FkbM family methyltransferase